VTLRQRIRFYQQLAVLVRAGVPIRASLTKLKERISGHEMRVLSEKLNAGDRIGDAFAAARFSPFECHLVTAGEQSGHLDTIFEHLSAFWSRELKMREAMIRPLYYPLVVLHLAMIVWAIVDYATTSSMPTVIVHFILRMAVFYTICIVIYTLARVSWSSEVFRKFWLYVPFIGGALKTAYAYRWITALRLEFGAGISLYRAVGDAWRASGYVGCERLAEEGEQAMIEGTNLSALVTQWRQLPRDWIDFIETGELSGSFEEAFKTLEEEAARAWNLAQERMAEWLPKIAYFIVLLVIGAMVINLFQQALLGPIDNIQQQIDNATK
jgi:type IV pilus assembly protein PilC